jgi:hypothetical protein
LSFTKRKEKWNISETSFFLTFRVGPLKYIHVHAYIHT